MNEGAQKVYRKVTTLDMYGQLPESSLWNKILPHTTFSPNWPEHVFDKLESGFGLIGNQGEVNWKRISGQNPKCENREMLNKN